MATQKKYYKYPWHQSDVSSFSPNLFFTFKINATETVSRATEVADLVKKISSDIDGVIGDMQTFKGKVKGYQALDSEIQAQYNALDEFKTNLNKTQNQLFDAIKKTVNALAEKDVDLKDAAKYVNERLDQYTADAANTDKN